jgi:multidrug resistance efflux pump
VVAELRKIRTPWKQQWRRIRYQLLPVVMMAGCSLAVGVLWHRQYDAADALGHVQEVKALATARQAGTLVPLAGYDLSLYDAVVEGDVVARLDDRAVLARLATLGAELSRLRAELAGHAGSRGDSPPAEPAAALAAVELETARIDMLQQTLLALQTRIEMQRQEAAVAGALHALLRAPDGANEPRPAVAERDAAQARLNLLSDKRGSFVRGAQAARERAATLSQATGRQDVPQDMAPVVASVHVASSAHEATLQHLELEVDGLEIHAPLGGKIVSIFRRPGESVQAGGEVMAIASDQADRVVAYLRPEQRVTPTRGATVYLWPRTNIGKPIEAKVEAVGPALEEIPDIVARNQKTREWGLPVTVRLPAAFQPRPGDVVNVRFVREGGR